MSHSAVVGCGPAFRLARKGIPARSAAAVTQRAGAEQRTRASGLTAAGDRARGRTRSERSEGIQSKRTRLAKRWGVRRAVAEYPCVKWTEIWATIVSKSPVSTSVHGAGV